MEQIPWKKLLAYKQTWAFAIAKFLTDPIWYFYFYWLPKCFDKRFHLGLSRIGLPLIVVYNFSAIGSIGGEWLPTAFHKTEMPIVKARLSAMLVCACLILPFFLSDRFSSLWSAVRVVVGIGGMAGSADAVLFSVGTGFVLQSYHSYNPLFSIAAASYLVGLLFLHVMAPGLRRVDAAQSQGAD